MILTLNYSIMTDDIMKEFIILTIYPFTHLT